MQSFLPYLPPSCLQHNRWETNRYAGHKISPGSDSTRHPLLRFGLLVPVSTIHGNYPSRIFHRIDWRMNQGGCSLHSHIVRTLQMFFLCHRNSNSFHRREFVRYWASTSERFHVPVCQPGKAGSPSRADQFPPAKRFRRWQKAQPKPQYLLHHRR